KIKLEGTASPAQPTSRKPKKAAGSSKARKPSGPSVTELITKAVSASKERKGLSLAVLKKALAVGGYDVEKNNSRIKLGLKSLVSKGTLVQTKGAGASSSFVLSKKPGKVQQKAPRKKLATKKPSSAAERCPNGAKELTAAAAKNPKKATRPRKEAKSLAERKRTKAKAKHAASKEKVKWLESNIMSGKNPSSLFRATRLIHKGAGSNSRPIFLKKHPIQPEMLEK
uniref:H15 domain-containing protein n=1 Tax=Apteryx owenii TaxID=8824 RepID=A0A8B9P427_APTOW